jgi:isopenicillin N synthase-like dioxygenase
VQLPLIDIAPFLAGDRAGMAATAARVDAVCRDIGFMVVTGHGIPQTLFADSFASARAYFAQDMAAKLAAAPKRADVFRGYEKMGTRYRDAGPEGGKVADYKEAFMISSPEFDRAVATPAPAGFDGMYAPNIWPSEPAGAPAGFRKTFEEFYRAVDNLARTLNGACAMALGLQRDYFAPFFDGHASTCTWVHYPAQDVAPAPGQMRIPAHTDSTSLTVVVQDGSQHGLEIRTRDGQWHAVAAPEGAVAINLGDLMAQWSNDRWVSTLHRVDNPPREIARTTPRFSLCFFQKPHVDAEIACLPNCAGPGNPAKYPPVKAGDYIRAKMLRTRPKTDAAA